MKYIIHFEFDFSSVIPTSSTINQYNFDITAYDARDGYERVSIVGQWLNCMSYNKIMIRD